MKILFCYSLKFEMCAQVISQVGGFSPDMADFGAGCMSGLKPPTYNIFGH